MHVSQLQPNQLYSLRLTLECVVLAYVLNIDRGTLLVTRYGDYLYHRNDDICPATRSNQFPGSLPLEGWHQIEYSEELLTSLIYDRFQLQLRLDLKPAEA